VSICHRQRGSSCISPCSDRVVDPAQIG
jgi:hypothetical protein